MLSPSPFVRRSAFTLIELLTVIAIIAQLAAILFPVFSRARENARRSSCSSNLRQLGMAMLQYTQDYDERMPFFFYGANGDTNDPAPATERYKWMDAIFPYVKSEQVYSCPSDADASKYNYIYYKNLSGADDTHYGSYGLNNMYRYDYYPNLRQPPSGSGGKGMHLAAVADPSGTIWLGDIPSGQDVSSFGWQCKTIVASECTSPQLTPTISYVNKVGRIHTLVARHLDTTNILFTDGHVKSQKLEAIASRIAPDGVTLAAFTVQNDG